MEQIQLRPSVERGQADYGWLKARYTFSFANYHDRQWMGFSSLRVINQDRVAPARGFETHPHRDMEIITLVLRGALEHRDSMGEHGVLRPGQVQAMSAGTGIEHSERNPSPTEELELMQIWIVPKARGLTPRYETRDFSKLIEAPGLVQLVSGDGADGSLKINQDARLFHLRLAAGGVESIPVLAGRQAWIQVLEGGIEIGGRSLGAGDAAGMRISSSAEISAQSDARALIFDLV